MLLRVALYRPLFTLLIIHHSLYSSRGAVTQWFVETEEGCDIALEEGSSLLEYKVVSASSSSSNDDLNNNISIKAFSTEDFQEITPTRYTKTVTKTTETETGDSDPVIISNRQDIIIEVDREEEVTFYDLAFDFKREEHDLQYLMHIKDSATGKGKFLSIDNRGCDGKRVFGLRPNDRFTMELVFTHPNDETENDDNKEEKVEVWGGYAEKTGSLVVTLTNKIIFQLKKKREDINEGEKSDEL